ncbi:fimbrillin family protein [Sphingobacterium sp. 1.A.5]|uniref:fimbrillin family protein n=1 Tax=Sphingobacterium sp. 1.A.5 TaxID=2044604 RepID=UPI0015D4B202|nr:hypothetical protein [Sphingobacterium sp. 1.A.5]
MFKDNTKIKGIKLLAFIALVVLIILASCQKSKDESIGNSEAKLKVNLSVGEPEEEKIVVAGRQTTRRSTGTVQRSNINLGGGMSLEVTVSESEQPRMMEGITKNSSSATALKASGSSVLKVLEKDTKYRVVVYNESGRYLETHDYVYGNEISAPAFPLSAGETYTFIVYSINSKTEIPDIESQEDLETAKLKDISSDLMFFKKTLEVNPGDNNLNAILHHQFSQITTTLEMDENMTGSIESLNGTAFGPTKNSATLRFIDGSLEFPNGEANASVSFPNVQPGIRTITSDPSFLISPTTTTANFKIASMVIDSETKTDISIPDIKITPGHRYNLIIKIKSCLQDVTSADLNWDYDGTSWRVGRTTYYGIYKDDERRYYQNGELIYNEFTAPEANYGFQFDIIQFDNAFNMKVNGKHIFSNSDRDQIQFETVGGPGGTTNIEFEDGTQYGENMDMIYDLRGTLERPILRIMISRNGEVKMFGSKVNNGPLFPLKLKDGKTFNNVIWNKTGSNSVVVSQQVSGPTVIIGKGRGRKTIPCRGAGAGL